MNNQIFNPSFKTSFINNDYLIILSLLIGHTDYSTAKKTQLIVANSLIHTSITLHDTIDSPESDQFLSKRKKDLIILAGDYNMRLFYKTLSEIEEIELIQALSFRLKEIIIFKMSLSDRSFKTFQEYIEVVINIETILITTLAEYFNKDVLSGVLKKLIILSKLKDSLNRYQYGQSTLLIDYWQKTSGECSATVVLQFKNHFKRTVDKVELLIQSIPDTEALGKADAKNVLAKILGVHTSTHFYTSL